MLSVLEVGGALLLLAYKQYEVSTVIIKIYIYSTFVKRQEFRHFTCLVLLLVCLAFPGREEFPLTSPL